MLKSQKLEIEAGEKRQALSALVKKDTLTDEERVQLDGLTTRLLDIETEKRGALVAEDIERAAAGPSFGDNEHREMPALVDGSSLGRVFAAIMSQQQPSGREAELQQHLGLAGNMIPLALLRSREPETRAQTQGPSSVGVDQHTIVPGVFPQSCGMWIGCGMPTVGVGETTFPVLETNANAENLAEGASGTETDGTFAAALLAPTRIQAEFFYSREDRARFAGMDESLRKNLSDSLAAGLDKNIIAGPNGLLGGSNLTAVATTTRDTFATYRSRLVYGRIDGTSASMASDLKMVVGAATLADMAGQYRGNSADDSALDSIMRLTSGVKVSAHVPAVDTTKQDVIVRRGMHEAMKAPIWEGVEILTDDLTKAKTGQVVLTAIMLHAVRILRTADWSRVETKHA